MSARCTLLFAFVVALLPMPAVLSGEKGAEAPEVSVARPIVREVTDYHETTGRLQASARVKLRALANGILTAVRFKDGDQVKQGDVLFEIDPRPYQARHDQAQSQVDLAKATLQLARATLTRDLAAAKAAPGSVSQQQLDQDNAAVNEAGARVKAAEAGATLTKLDLDFCKVKAPFAGRIGRALVDPGNIVREDQTQELAVLVRDDPIYVDFDISERTYLELMRTRGTTNLPVEAAVHGDEKFSRRGVVRVVDRFTRESGSVSLQATLENKDRLLLPGSSLRVRFALRGPYKAILLREGIVKANLDRSYVFVVDAKDKVQVREVTLGGAQPDELRVIAKGLTAEDRVIVGRTTGLKPGMAVRPKQVEMPESTAWLDDLPPRLIKSAQRPIGFGVTVDANCSIAQAQAVYDNVGFPIESQVNSLEGLRYLRSRCTRDGRYMLDIAFASGVDLGRAQARVKERVDRELPKLPVEVRTSGVQVRGGSAGVLQIIRLTSTDGKHDQAFLGNYANLHIKRWLAREVGVADVALFGATEHGVRVQLDMDRMRAYKVSPAEAVRLLQKVKRQPKMEPWALEEIILRANVEGEVLRLRDIGKVTLGLVGTPDECTADGQPATALVVYLAPDASPAKVRARLATRLDWIREDLPAGMTLQSDFDFTPHLGWLSKSAGADYAVVDLYVAPYLRAKDAKEVLAKCEEAVRGTPGVKHTLALTSNPFDVFGGGPCVLVRFDPPAPGKADRAETLRAIRNRLDPVKNVIERVRDLSQPGGFPRCAYPIDFALYGPDADEVFHWAVKLTERLQKKDSLTDVWLDRASRPSRSYYVEADPKQAAIRGVDLSEFDTALEVFFGSKSLVPPFHWFGHALPVEVSVQNAPRSGIWMIDLDNLCVRNSRDEMVRVTTFATLRQRESPLVLDFFNHRPMVQITANPAASVDLAAARMVCTKLAEETRRELRLPPEYRLAWLQP